MKHVSCIFFFFLGPVCHKLTYESFNHKQKGWTSVSSTHTKQLECNFKLYGSFFFFPLAAYVTNVWFIFFFSCTSAITVWQEWNSIFDWLLILKNSQSQRGLQIFLKNLRKLDKTHKKNPSMTKLSTDEHYLKDLPKP